jgi:hypothetical protein
VNADPKWATASSLIAAGTVDTAETIVLSLSKKETAVWQGPAGPGSSLSDKYW